MCWGRKRRVGRKSVVGMARMGDERRFLMLLLVKALEALGLDGMG